MTASLDDVRNAIAGALRALDGLKASPYIRAQVDPFEAQINVAGPTRETFTNEGAQRYTGSIVVYDQMTDEISAQRRFDQLRDPWHPKSLRVAVEADAVAADLAGVDNITVGPSGEVEVVTIGATDYLRVVWPFEFVIHQEDA